MYPYSQTSEMSTGTTIVYFAILILTYAAMWRLYTKADKEGWKCLIPFYNTYTLFQIIYGDENGMKFLFLLIPFYNIYVMIKSMIGLAKVYGKSGVYAVGLIFLSFIFLPLLAFGNAEYEGPQDW